MSQQQAAKPSLHGVRIKARKREAQAKHEPSVFRDQLLKHLEAVPENDFEALANKLVQAGSTLEFLKYSDALFEILFVGGLLQPGGNYLDDGAEIASFAIILAKEPTTVDEMKKYVDVLNKLIRRYKYLQKPLEDSSLPGLLQYAHRWPPPQREKLAITTGLLISQGLAGAGTLQSLTKDHLVKNDVSLHIITLVFRTYLADQSLDHLAGALKRGGVKDLLAFFPPSKRTRTALEAHFKQEGLSQVSDWYIKKQFAAVRESTIKSVQEMCSTEAPADEIVTFLKSQQEEQPLPEEELVQCIWLGLMGSIDWSARPDQIEGSVVRTVTNNAPVLEPFSSQPKTQVALINSAQVYCYEQTRLIKTFPQLVKILYNKDCITSEAIIYWHQKGAKPQGKQHFLNATESLVKFLQEEDSDEEE